MSLLGPQRVKTYMWLAHDGNGAADADHLGRPIIPHLWYEVTILSDRHEISDGPFLDEGKEYRLTIDSIHSLLEGKEAP